MAKVSKHSLGAQAAGAPTGDSFHDVLPQFVARASRAGLPKTFTARSSDELTLGIR